MQRTSGVKNLVIYGKKLRKLPRVFYLPNSGRHPHKFENRKRMQKTIRMKMADVELLNSREFKLREYSQERSREYSLSREFIENLGRNIFFFTIDVC